jgi:endonuclease YncB( thermonuclease family)
MRRADAALAAEARRLTEAFTRIRNLHRSDVSAAVAPTALIGAVDERGIRAKHRKVALAGIPRSDRSGRSAAKALAKAPADREIAATRLRMAAERDATQADLDTEWDALVRNDPSAVLHALRQSYEDNDIPAAPLIARGDTVALAVLVPDPTSIPAKLPVTDGGRMALRTLTPAEPATYYRELVCGHLLAAVRQAFAAAPGIASVRAVVLRSAGPDAYGRPTADCLLATHLTRAALEGVRWSEADASRIVADTSTDLLTNPGPHAARLDPVDVAGHPGLAALMAKVDLAGLASRTRFNRPQRARTARPASPFPARAMPWPDLARARDAGAEWIAARSRAQRGALVGVVVFLMLGIIGALAGPDTTTTIDSGGASSATNRPPAGPAADNVATTLPTPSPPATTRVAEGVPAGGEDTTVVRVIDGDTMEVSGGIRVRLIGIDTPETVEPGTPVQCFGPEATRYANEIVPPGTRVRLIHDVARTDSFGRSLAYVYKLDDGLFVNRAVARNGFALQSTVPPNVAHAEEFRVAVAEARDAGLGLWRTCQSTTTAVPPTTVRTTTAPATVAPTPRPTVAAATPCTATVSNASPTRNATVTVYISSEYPSSSSSATAHYKTTDTTNSSTTDTAGAANIPFRISSATPGYRVVIDVTVAGTSHCQTSFTPVG